MLFGSTSNFLEATRSRLRNLRTTIRRDTFPLSCFYASSGELELLRLIFSEIEAPLSRTFSFYLQAHEIQYWLYAEGI